ncbi:MAG: aminodeoxychorismate synthase component I [Candidatus Sumerlaeia bacterium]|nr:aminodeoxychorismate synthase component I [Candidatus Sumerlaeia bacterium]
MQKHSTHTPIVLFESYDPERNPRSFCFSGYSGAVAARKPEEVPRVLDQIEAAAVEGYHAAGFLTYEAAAGLDPVLRVKKPAKPAGHLMDAADELPLAWFALFRTRTDIAPGTFGSDEDFALSDWTPSLDRDDYIYSIERIRNYIAQGHTYQVNFTFRQRAQFEGSTVGFYRALCRSQRAGFCAYLDLGRHAILSASPEMFFSLAGNELMVRPMKGTAPRGRTWEEDEAIRRTLRQCPKNCAENVMIVDLMRNDLGRIAEIGSVCVPRLYDIERYETVFQMTSTVRCRVRPDVRLGELFAALFPSGSVTGAPKIRTMQIIDELESDARGIYTGAIGFLSPGNDALFNVAIRTVLVDRAHQQAEFGVGSGITFDSDPAAEYHECILKSRFLLDAGLSHSEGRVGCLSQPAFSASASQKNRVLPARSTPASADFELFETFLYELPEGFFLLERHLERLAHSAAYFRFRFDRAAALRTLHLWIRHSAAQSPERRFRVRLTLSRHGSFDLACRCAPTPPAAPPKVALATGAVDSADPFLYHKTTRREIYDHAARTRPDCADVLLINERGELTESTIANLVVALDGRLVTPPVRCGLLPGTFRAELLARGSIAERVLFPDDLRRAETIYLINALRKWTRVELID